MSHDRLRRVEELYHAALSRPPEVRGAFVAEACGPDESLRREIDSLLGYAGRGGFLEQAPAAPRLTPGHALGHYTVVGPLGKGGMGEVYRARDTRLPREVAIKVLPALFAFEPDRRKRLEREAQAVSALNHPHICTLHDVGHHEGLDFLVMELVEGETLADRLAKGPMPVAEALARAVEIAGALSAAHRRGIVHRDLKPGNVMLTKSGAKLLDFGLARFVARVGALAPVGATDTSLTERGAIVGTVQYMAPEQLEGREADARTDIFAFGAVLYEMVTGRRAFEGSSQAGVIGAILKDDPPAPSSVITGVSKSLDRAVRKCLAKDPEERWQDARDLEDELKWIAERSASDTVGAVEPPLRLRWYAISAVAAILLLSVSAIWTTFRPKAEPGPSRRLAVPLPPEAPLASPALSHAMDKPVLDISRDGRQLVYVAQVQDQAVLYVIDLTTGGARRVPGTEGASTPFFSPDGQSVAFVAERKLQKVALGGGPPTVLAADVGNPWGGMWAPDNTIIFNRNEVRGLDRVSADGGPIAVVNKSPPLNMPALGPGNTLLASRVVDGIVWLRTGTVSELLPDGMSPRYVRTGHLVYAEPGRLMAAPLDTSRMITTGPAVPLATDLRTGGYGTAQFSVSDEGTLFYAAGSDELLVSFEWVDQHGNVRPLGLPEKRYGYFSLSPDGHRLAVAERTPDLGDDLWIYDLERAGHRTRIIRSETSETHPQILYLKWLPDGKHIVFWRRDRPHSSLVVVATDRAGTETVLWTADDPAWMYPMSFSPDGTLMTAFDGRLRDYVFRIRNADGTLAANVEPQRISERWGGGFVQFSPDGQSVVYANGGIFVARYPDVGPPCRVTPGGGPTDPSWISGGREIMYVDVPAAYAVEVLSIPDCRFGPPRLLFRGEYPDRPGFGHDVRNDGQEFLMARKAGWSRTAASINVITNVFDELRRRVPSAR